MGAEPGTDSAVTANNRFFCFTVKINCPHDTNSFAFAAANTLVGIQPNTITAAIAMAVISLIVIIMATITMAM
jgi:hypothetical protein